MGANGSPELSICVLGFRDGLDLLKRCIQSIATYCPSNRTELIVGVNEPSQAMLEYVLDLHAKGWIQHLCISPENLNKNPMMRRMFTHVSTEFIWWFDDDSYLISHRAFDHWLDQLKSQSEDVAQVGATAYVDWDPNLSDSPLSPVEFVRAAPWYQGFPPPTWRPGGKGEFNFRGNNTGDGRWYFATGGCWLARTQALRAMDWPDPRLKVEHEDIYLGEAIRQHGWRIINVTEGVVFSDAPSRWRHQQRDVEPIVESQLRGQFPTPSNTQGSRR